LDTPLSRLVANGAKGGAERRRKQYGAYSRVEPRKAGIIPQDTALFLVANPQANACLKVFRQAFAAKNQNLYSSSAKVSNLIFTRTTVYKSV
jgi:hypothetical protein